MDGVCKRAVVCKDGCYKCQACDVQFLFLFNDRSIGLVCQPGRSLNMEETKFYKYPLGFKCYEYSGNGTEKKNSSA